jgi:hypothetical protein
MAGGDFDWNRSYFLPASLRFRPSPGGALQLDGDGSEGVAVPGDRIALLFAFAQAQSAAAAYESAGRQSVIDRDEFRAIVETWSAQGLLRNARTAEATPTRLALFAKAAEEYYGSAHRHFPLRSHFELQRPAIFYPGLATREIHDRRRFPWVAALEGAFPLIRQELDQLLASGDTFASVHRAQTSTGEWAAAYFWSFGEKVEETCRACPETARALAGIAGVPQFGTTLFSALAPRTRIAPHYGYSNAKLRCQLPLRVPGGCQLKVGDHEIAQQEGTCIVFDDSFLHSAWNDSDEARFVLVFDFFHPDLAVGEIAYLAQLARRRELGKPYLGAAAAAEKVGWTRPAAGAGAEIPERQEKEA